MKLWHYILVFVWAAGMYANTLGHDYALDDQAIITHNKFTQKGFAGVADHFTHSYWFGLNGKNEGNYRPLSGAIFSIERGLFGNNPSMGHLLNVLFYGLLCVVLLQWLHRMNLMHPLVLLGIMLLFASHPLHTEVVANIKSRDEIFCFLFFALSANYFWTWLQDKKPLQLALSGLFLLLSVLSKETAIALLPIFLVMAWRKGASWIDSIKSWIVPLGVSGLYAVLYLSVTEVLGDQQYHIFDNSLVQEASAADLLATKLFILGEYFKLLFIPHPLVYDYSYNTIPLTSFGDIQVLITLAILLCLAGWTAWSLKQRSGDATTRNLLAITLLTLPVLPVSNLLFPIGSTMAERFMFIPSLGFAILLGIGLDVLLKRAKQAPEKPSLAILGTVALIFAFITIQRNPDWKDNETLFAADLEHLPQSAKAHHNLANIYQQKGDAVTAEAAKRTYYESAIGLIEQAVAIYPVQEFHKQLGQLYGNVGRWDGVIKSLTEYIEYNKGDAVVWNQLGIANGMSGNIEEALVGFEQSYQLNPNDADVCNNLGKTYASLGRAEEALNMFEQAVQLNPKHAEARQNLDYFKASQVNP